MATVGEVRANVDEALNLIVEAQVSSGVITKETGTLGANEAVKDGARIVESLASLAKDANEVDFAGLTDDAGGMLGQYEHVLDGASNDTTTAVRGNFKAAGTDYGEGRAQVVAFSEVVKRVGSVVAGLLAQDAQDTEVYTAAIAKAQETVTAKGTEFRETALAYRNTL